MVRQSNDESAMSPSYRLSYAVDKEGKENRKPHTSKIISFLVFKWCD